MLQTARSLLKGLVAAKGGKRAQGSGAYLSEVQAEAGRRCTVRSAAGWLQPEAQLAALRCPPGTGLALGVARSGGATFRRLSLSSSLLTDYWPRVLL